MRADLWEKNKKNHGHNDLEDRGWMRLCVASVRNEQHTRFSTDVLHSHNASSACMFSHIKHMAADSRTWRECRTGRDVVMSTR